MSRASMVAAMTSGRPPIVGVSQYGVGFEQVQFEIGWPEFDRDVAWARRLVAAAGIGQGDHVVFTALNAEGPWISPLVRAVRDAGAVHSNAEVYKWDARRIAAFLQLLPVKAVLGISLESAEALLADEGSAELLKKVPLLWARPEAVPVLRGAGLQPAVIAMLGPALGVECPVRAGLHLDPGEWRPRGTPEGLTLDVTGERRHRKERIALGLQGRVEDSPCECGLPGPRIVAEGLG